MISTKVKLRAIGAGGTAPDTGGRIAIRPIGLAILVFLLGAGVASAGDGRDGPVSSAGYSSAGDLHGGVAQAHLKSSSGAGVIPAGGGYSASSIGGVAPVGFFPSGGASSESSTCDSSAACDGGSPDCGCSSCSTGSCSTGSCSTGGCGVPSYGSGSCGCGGQRRIGSGLIRNRMMDPGLMNGGLMNRGCGCGGPIRNAFSGGGCGCGGGLSELRRFCLFCRGDGCTACQSIGRGQLIGGLGGFMASLRPYTGGGLGAQRWFDISGEAVWLGHTTGGGSGVITTQGVGGAPVLSLGQTDVGDLTAGFRVSAAMIFGVGGNLEATYMGGQEWDGTASVASGAADLFSFISDFGTNPGGADPGFDDTDRSLSQSIRSSSRFHSGEINYRRRTVGAYNRFQGSWLVGLRYLRFDNELQYETRGQDNNTAANNGARFFSSLDSQQNSMLGVQGGFDLWWNVTPGVNFGLGFKGGWLDNDVDRSTVVTANSIAGGAAGTRVATGGDDTGTIMADFELKMLYRLSHSWTFRTAYYMIAVDDVAFGTTDADVVRGFVQSGPVASPQVDFDSLVLQGFSFGAEYLW